MYLFKSLFSIILGVYPGRVLQGPLLTFGKYLCSLSICYTQWLPYFTYSPVVGHLNLGFPRTLEGNLHARVEIIPRAVKTNDEQSPKAWLCPVSWLHGWRIPLFACLLVGLFLKESRWTPSQCYEVFMTQVMLEGVLRRPQHTIGCGVSVKTPTAVSFSVLLTPPHACRQDPRQNLEANLSPGSSYDQKEGGRGLRLRWVGDAWGSPEDKVKQGNQREARGQEEVCVCVWGCWVERKTQQDCQCLDGLF